ncbi:hypothetical protein V2I01_21885 [Micromonospora sp. BRA006-A]|nr:hypothetical protein [Micromonospora sp. BRA006-A]
MAYLDHAATTPMLDEAPEAYVAVAREVGNASSLHGRVAGPGDGWRSPVSGWPPRSVPAPPR